MARVHVLGAGTPTPTRFGSSYVVEVAGAQLMIDCGLATTYKLVKAGLWPTDIDYLFFTHHHFDHDIDYPCFLLCRWDQSIGNENRLQVYGPTLTERITEGILGEGGVFAHDWKARVNHPLSQRVYVNRGGTLPRTPPDVLAKDVRPGRVYSSTDWEMTAAPAEHVQPYLDSLASRLDSHYLAVLRIIVDRRPISPIAVEETRSPRPGRPVETPRRGVSTFFATQIAAW